VEKARDKGYAINREELGLGVIVFAAPVLDCAGKVVAAVSLTLNGDRLPKKREKRIIDELMKGAMIISREMGYFPENMGTGVAFEGSE
jgi:DNA-binding IclR family transcriptional regulator